MDHLLSREQSHPLRESCLSPFGSGASASMMHFTNCILLIILISFTPALTNRGSVSREDSMSTRWMPWRCVPMKDGAPLRYALGSRLQAVSQRSPNEATHRFGGTGLVPEGTRPTETSQ